MHILKIIHGYPPAYNAGSEVYSQSICNELSTRHQVSVFTREENPYSPDFQIRHLNGNSNLNFYFVNNSQGKEGYRHKKMDSHFSDLIKQIKPDIAHIGHLNHLSTGLVDELNNLKIPIVFTLHDFWLMCPRGQFLTRSIGEPNNFQVCSGQRDSKCAADCYRVYFSGRHEDEDIHSWSKWIHTRMIETRSIIEKVNLLIAPSQYLRNRFINEFSVPDSKIIYLDYGFPTGYLTPTQKTKAKNDFTFGYIGTHVPAKGLNQLIEAFQQIEEPATLKIFGRENGQSTQSLKLLAVKSKNKIEFAGEYVNNNLANEVFSNVDCIVVPSIWAENSPLVIHEAQSCNIPVITANIGGMKEYVQHQVNGLLFEHRNTSSLLNQMNFAIKNPNLMKQYGSRGYLYSEDGNPINIQDHCNELVDIYQRCIDTQYLWRITLDTNPEDCNLNCIMCEEHSPYSNFIPKLTKETGVKRRRMRFQLIEKVFEQAVRLGVREIIPSTMGEPLLYKDIVKIFTLAQKHNIKINLTTNGTFPKMKTEEWAALIVPNTSDIKISWNGATKETAEKIMLGVNFNQALENVKTFIKYRDDYHTNTGKYCRVTFQMTFMQSNLHELNDIIKLAASLGVDRVKGHQCWIHFDELEGQSLKSTKDSIANWNAVVSQAYEVQNRYRKPNGNKVILENIMLISERKSEECPENYECPFLRKELWISATGDISPCCAPDSLRKSLGSYGNIETLELADVFQSIDYKHLVRTYKSNPLCKTCNMRKPL
jgi:glycosyltransferase involved in cell wall biosynthesis/MoaA/NifB/PqqE/SkfB family radical SAM enzyme